MKKTKKNQVKILRNYIEKAILKTADIEANPLDNSIERINTELKKVLSLIDEIK